MFLNSIRWRLQLWHGLLLVLVLAGFGLTAYQLQRANQYKRIDQELQRRMTIIGGALRRQGETRPRPPSERLPPLGRPLDEPAPLTGGGQGAEPAFPRPGPPGSPSAVERERPVGEPEDIRFPEAQRQVPPIGDFPPPAALPRRLYPQELSFFEGAATNAFYYAVWARDGRLLSKSESAPEDVSQPLRSSQQDEARMRGTLRELFRYTPPGECLLVGKDIYSELAELRRFAGLLLGAGGSVLVLGLAGGWWLSTRAIRPINDISATASKISSGDLSLRIPAADTDNELGQLAAVLNSTFARLEAAFQQQARFTADAAHELRTPVSVMLTQTQSALTRDRPAAEYREAVEACQRAAQRMRGLIESLLELAWLDAGREPMKLAPFDLAQTATESVDLVRPLASERGITMHTDLPCTECLGNSERVALVITNLLTNAVYYNKDQGEIRISARCEGGAVTLTVADTGQGIAAEDLPHVFERFWRADPSRSRANGRTGLGLAISKSIVEAHGGSIEAISELGKGTTFTVRLPALA
jgi:heavy metal sensor kinase